MYKEQEMSGGVVVAFSLPGPSDEGMCSDYLTQYLVNAHNEFVQRADQASLLRDLDAQRHSTRNVEVESSFMTQAHALEVSLTSADIDGDSSSFAAYVEKQCVSYSEKSGETIYDYSTAEKYCLDRYFRNKPLLNLRLRGFNFSDEQSEARASLASKVAQKPLPHTLATRICEQLKGTSASLQALQTLETVINFLTATLSTSFESATEVHTVVGERNLGQYLAEDLLMPEAEVAALGTAIVQKVSLKHLDALCELLRNQSGVDPLKNVAALYQAPLEPDMTEALTSAAPKLELRLLVPVLRAFLIGQCVSEDISAGSALKDSIDWLTDDESGDFFSELPWFENFPAVVPMACASATLDCLIDLLATEQQ